METEPASLFESSEMVATFVASTPLLSQSWSLCKSIDTTHNAFSITRTGDVAYVAFSGCVSGIIDDDIRVMAELEDTKLFSGLQGQQPPVVIHGSLLNLFMSMFRYSNFQAQIIQVIKETKSLVFTGHSIGGAIASLSSLWLLSIQHAPIQANNVLCITFGSPMLGNESLTRSILQNKWGGNFCHVIANHDIVPRILLLDSIPQLRTSFLEQFPNLENHQCRFFLYVLSCLESETNKSCSFWPFGSFLFCTNNGAICVENAKAVIEMMNLMMTTASNISSIHDHFIYEYYIDRLNLKSFLKSGDEDFREGVISCSSYDVGLALALQSSNLASTHESVSEEAKDCLRMAKRMARTPNLNNAHLAIALSKITPLRAQIEWYKSSCDKSDHRLGYYDTFKLRGASKRDAKVNMNRIRLSKFWDELIQKIDSNQLTHDFHKREKWVNASHFYKLLVEPLDIAEYYRMGNHKIRGHYLEHGRDRKYKIFDTWWKNRGVEDDNVRTRFASLTQDSCFWARVEEAKDWVENVRVETNVKKISLMWEKIDEFERYARSMIENKEISTDVLLENSSYSLLMKELGQLKHLSTGGGWRDQRGCDPASPGKKRKISI